LPTQRQRRPKNALFDELIETTTAMPIIGYPFQPGDVEKITACLVQNQGTVVYPTETYYALGCIANSPSAVRKIYQLKQRQPDAPLLVLIDSWSMLEAYAQPIDPDARRLLEHHWPGPLTAVLPARNRLAPELNRTHATLGFRFTSSPIAQALIRATGLPLVGTSANLSAGRSIAHFHEARQLFAGQVDLMVDGGETPGGLPSTLIAFTPTGSFRILRQGALQLDPNSVAYNSTGQMPPPQNGS
jgi:L-threonylcarbamoyladenylate synthase